MNINILQGSDKFNKDADVTIIIDVIRAFTTTQVAFTKNIKQVIFVKDTKEAFELKYKNPEYLLLGEENAFPIENFDFDNSPLKLYQSEIDIKGKTIVQRTTNGARAVVNNYNKKTTLVTGFTNAYNTALYIKGQKNIKNLNIIASHPSSDEDIACAEYIENILLNKPVNINAIKKRIKNADAAAKFFTNKSFMKEDIEFCISNINNSRFVMKVSNHNKLLITKKIIF